MTQGLERLSRDHFGLAVHRAREPLDEVAHQPRNVLGPLAQRRNVEGEHVEPVVKVVPEALLLMPIVRFLPPEDERLRATVLAIANELTEHGLVLRYKVEETDDGLHGKEGTFAICSFWLVAALSEIGEKVRARGLCERMLALASPLGLYGEEIEADTGRHLGNFPQAFTHLALISAAYDLDRRLSAAGHAG